MNLVFYTQSVNRDMKITASNDKQYYLVDVIAHILKYLKDKLISQLRRAGHPLETIDFDWVITVPAIWRARGKQMMREAGYKVCTIIIIINTAFYMHALNFYSDQFL